MTIKQSWYIYSILLYLCFNPFLLQADECSSNQCNYSTYFDKAGFYLARISLPESGQAGIWGAAISIRTEDGGSIGLQNLSTGSSSKIQNGLPSWVAFYLPESQALSLTPFNYLQPDQPIMASLYRDTENGRVALYEPTLINSEQTHTTPMLEAGFYIASITSNDNSDIYAGLAVQADKLSNIINGGWLELNSLGGGFVSFYVSQPSTVQFDVYFADNYSTLGASQPQIDIDFIETSGERKLLWHLYDGFADPVGLSDLEILQQIKQKYAIDETILPINPITMEYLDFITYSPSTWLIPYGYAIDENGNMTGLSLSINTTEFPPLLLSLENLTWLNLLTSPITSLPSDITKLQNLQRLHIRFNQLNTLPAEIGELTQLTHLDLRGNPITSLPAEIGLLTNLTELGLSFTDLTSLPPEIAQLQNLKTIDLRGNTNISSELINSLATLPNLSTLDLRQCELETLPTEIGQLTHLTSLQLSSNQLTTLPAEIGQLTHSTSLQLSRNQLTTLPTEIGQLANLTELNLSENQLTTLPVEIGQLANLATLDVSENQLTSLPSEIGQLSNLTQLRLEKNQLTTVPSAIGQLVQLTDLYLNENRLENIPSEIGNLQNITVLELDTNPLQSLPTTIGQLKKLPILYLANTQLTTLPTEIGQLTALTRLIVSNNPQFNVVPVEIGQLQNLDALIIESNPQLTSLPSEIGQLQNLTELSLASNTLTVIPSEIGQLQKLVTLYLWNNQLTGLPPEIFQIQTLEELNLSNNQLTSLPVEITNLPDDVNIIVDRNSTIGEIMGAKMNIFIEGNPLVSPPLEIVGQGIPAIRTYFANQN